jgi:hypothetical protein
VVRGIFVAEEFEVPGGHRWRPVKAVMKAGEEKGGKI